MEEIFAIIGKRPIGGFSKTRLEKVLGQEITLGLYRTFIKDFANNLRMQRAFLKYYVFGSPSGEETQRFFLEEFKGLNCTYLDQRELPFFLRLKDIFLEIDKREKNPFIHLTGTDIPDFPFHYLKEVRPSKDTVTIGPDKDGGFYYVGAPSPAGEIFEIESPMELAPKAKSLGYRVQMLNEWSDIDTVEDLRACILRNSKEKISHIRELWEV